MFGEERLGQIKEEEKSTRKAYLAGENKVAPSEYPGEFESNKLQEFKELLEEDLRAAEPITLREIVESYSSRLGKGKNAIEKMVNALVEENVLDKKGKGKNATYELNPVAFYPD